MSKAEILEELVRLTPEERREIRARLNELEGVTNDGWNDNGALTDEEKRLIESRVAEHERDPQSAISWGEFEARIKNRLEDPQDLRDLEAAIAENADKPLIPWEQAKAELERE